LMRGNEQFAPRLMDEQFHNVSALIEIDHQTHRLPVPPSTRQLRGVERVESAIGCEEQYLVRRLRMKREARTVSFLELHLCIGREMSLHRTDPALARADNG